MPLLRRLLVLAVLLGLLGCPHAAVGAEGDPVGVWPLQPEPEVVRGFDPPEVVWGSGHRGVDLLGSPGQAVHAALAGTVTFAGVLAGRGVVVVDQGETRTTYEPVTSSLDRGVTVAQGAVIGTLTTAGSHCPPRPCLHWGWKRGDEYLDPLRLVGVGAVRLLPLWRDEPVTPMPLSPLVAWQALPLMNPYVDLLAKLLLARPPPAVLPPDSTAALPYADRALGEPSSEGEEVPWARVWPWPRGPTGESSGRSSARRSAR